MVTEIILETAVGAFFALSGWHKLTNAKRKAALAETLADDLPRLGLPAWCRPFMMIWLPSWELGAGSVAFASALWHWLGLAIVAKLAMVPIITIMVMALICEGKQRVADYQPLDRGDAVDDWLYLPESLLGLMAVAALVA